MLSKRIIACLDVKDGRTVKGVQFENLRDAGDAVENAARYCEAGIDELVFLDISATLEGRTTFAELVKRIAKAIRIPFTVGGGIRSVREAHVLLSGGADKVSINSAALDNPGLISELSAEFGSQAVVVALDVRILAGQWKVFTRAGTEETRWDAVSWALEACERGAGELLLTSMDNDGAQSGYAIELTKAVSQAAPVPVIASGGAGTKEHFRDVFKVAKADAALGASVFHFGTIPVPDLKKFLHGENICVRL